MNSGSPPPPESDGGGLNLAALRRQDQAEFERFYLAYAPAIRLYLLRLARQSETAQDLLQDTFVKAYFALPRTGPDLRLRPWLYRIATNTARSHFRAARWKQLLSLNNPASAVSAAVTRSFETGYAEAEAVEQTLASLKPDYAAVLILRWREGFSIDELCGILGLSRENLKKRLYRAKRAFEAAYLRSCAEVDD